MTNELKIGQRIETTDDAGIVDAIDGDQVTVRWDSGIVTIQRAQALLATMGQRSDIPLWVDGEVNPDLYEDVDE